MLLAFIDRRHLLERFSDSMHCLFCVPRSRRRIVVVLPVGVIVAVV